MQHIGMTDKMATGMKEQCVESHCGLDAFYHCGGMP